MIVILIFNGLKTTIIFLKKALQLELHTLNYYF